MNTNKQNSFDKIKALYVMTFITGAVLALGAAGETDYNDAKMYENQNLGYEKNTIKDLNTYEYLGAATLLMGVGAFGIWSRNRKNGQER